MAFQISPGINVSEFNLTTVVPAVASTQGGIAGVFSWGPVNERVLVTSETDLVNTFGKPTANNYETFFTAADFLAYSNQLYVVRVAPNTSFNAGASNTQILTATAAEANTSIPQIIARYPGVLGNSLKVSVCQNANVYSSAIANVNINTGSITANTSEWAQLVGGDILTVGNTSIGFQDLVVAATPTTITVTFTSKYTLSSNLATSPANRKWAYYKNIAKTPAANSVHIAIVDEDGDISGVAGTVLEIYEQVSVVSSAKKLDGSSNFYRNIINNRSKWVYATGNTIVTTGVAAYSSLSGGVSGDEKSVTLGVLTAGYDKFVSPQDVDVSFILAGKPREGTIQTGVANYIIDNICEIRKDCMAFISPSANNANNVLSTAGNEVDDMIAFRNALSSSSYAVMDTGYKYRYDRYNDVYRYTPMNGDIAGLLARTAQEKDPWYSPAGYNRGKLKNVVKLAFNPNAAQRDILYPADINPVISEGGQGTLLFGDKTLIGNNSAFDRINVRRLFIVLEKAIAEAAKTTLFEFNDAFTRAQFKNIIEPFLRDVQGRRGIYDFKVVCDDTNNTPEIIDTNQFVGDIYIKPARSINYIQLNFVAVGTGVAFNEIIGQV